MSNLDQFFKDKFQDREFEFQEGYWEGAQKLIEQDDKRRRRGLWWRNLGLGVLLLTILSTGAGIYWWTSNNDPVATTMEITSMETITKEEAPISSPNDASTNNNEVNKNQTKTQNSPTHNSPNANQHLATANSDKVSSSKPNSNTSTSENTTLNTPTTTKQSTTSQQGIIENNSTTAIIPEEREANPNQLQSVNIEESGQQNSKAIDSSRAANEELNIAESPTNDLIRKNGVDTPPLSNTSAQTNPPTDPSDLFPIAAFDNLALLPILPLSAAEDPLVTYFRKAPEEQREKWSIGISLLSQFYPNWSSEAVWTGGAIGPTVGYALNDKLSIQVDLLYQIRRGNYGFLATSADRSYTFGLQENLSVLQPNSLHSLEIPLYLQWHNRKHTFEAGVFLSYLTGLRGQREEKTFLQPWERSRMPTNSFLSKYEIYYSESQMIEKGWLETMAFNRLRPGLLLGYRYRFTANWTANFQAKYYLKSTLVTPDATIVREQPPLRFSLGLTYYPFRQSRK